MTKLGGRKFVGFAILCLLGLVAAARGVDLPPNVVALLLGVYGIFSTSNAINGWVATSGRSSSDAEVVPSLGVTDVDKRISEALNAAVSPILNQLTSSHQNLTVGLTQVIDQVKKHQDQLVGRAQQNQQALQQVINGTQPPAYGNIPNDLLPTYLRNS